MPVRPLLRPSVAGFVTIVRRRGASLSPAAAAFQDFLKCHIHRVAFPVEAGPRVGWLGD